MKKLTKKQISELWGEGPYSQANLIIQTRILDDRISRVFVIVEVEINPFTFELVQKNRSFFKNNKIIQQLLDHAEYRGEEFGYVSCAFEKEFRGKNVLNKAKIHLDYSTDTLIEMHDFVMRYLGLKEDYNA